MRNHSVVRQRSVGLISMLAAFGVVALTNIASAQQSEEVTVVAPREITREQVGRSSSTGAAIEDITVSLEVAYRDLDLKKSADVDTLNKRIRDAAEDGCSELDKLLPLTGTSATHRDCIRKAVRSASAQIDAAVATAGKGYGNADHP